MIPASAQKELKIKWSLAPPREGSNTVITDVKGGLAVRIGTPSTNAHINEGTRLHENKHIEQFYETATNPDLIKGAEEGLAIAYPAEYRAQIEAPAYEIGIGYLKSIDTNTLNYQDYWQINNRIKQLESVYENLTK